MNDLVTFLASSSLIVAFCSLGNALIFLVGGIVAQEESHLARWERRLICFVMAATFLSLFFTRGVDFLVTGIIRFVTEGGSGWPVLIFEAARFIYIAMCIFFWAYAIYIFRRDMAYRNQS